MTDSSLCPRCKAPIRAQPGCTVACPACHGVFVAREHVASVVESLELGQVAVELGDAYRASPARSDVGASKVETEVRYLPCPVCAKPMNRKRLIKRLDLTVDICLAHGVWFDAGELHRVADSERKRTAGEQGSEGAAGARGIDLGMMGRVSGVPPLKDGSGS